jgi:hypothetical protein
MTEKERDVVVPLIMRGFKVSDTSWICAWCTGMNLPSFRWTYLRLIYIDIMKHGGTHLCSWLWHCATSCMVACSIPNGVAGIFHWHNPSSCIMVLGSTQPLTEMHTRVISWGLKLARA